jgi:hypothetical protein
MKIFTKKPGMVTGININLREHPKDSVGNIFVKWGVNTGKIIIVLTELVALSALFYRFSIDRKIVDLNDKIKKEETFIANQAPKEKEYRSIQNRLNEINLITGETDEKVRLINEIITTLKTGNFENTNISISKNTVRLTGNATSVFAVNSLINDIKQYPNVGNIRLDELNSTDQAIQFTIAVELNSQIHEDESSTSPIQQKSTL